MAGSRDAVLSPGPAAVGERRSKSPRESVTSSESSIRLLRIAAFLVDALLLASVILIPASAISYILLWTGGAIGRVGLVWWVALAIFVFALLLRDGWKGRSPGKRLMALSILTPSGSGCGYARSFLRNLPILVPGWNLIEAAIVLFGAKGRRSGDLLARTSVVEE